MKSGDILKDQWGVPFTVTEVCFDLDESELDEGEEEAFFVKLKDAEGLPCNGFAIKKELNSEFVLDEIETEAESEKHDAEALEDN